MRQSLVVIALVISAATSASGGPVSPPPIAPGQPTPGQPTPGQATPARATPARDPVKGTAVLRGQVVDAVTGTPVRRARVSAFASQQSGLMPVPGQGTATTDGDGRFEIRDLPPGRYTLSASKAGYISMRYGQKPMTEPATPIDVLDGQRVEKIVIGIPRGGVISGRVLDEFGDPVIGVQVQAMRYRYQNGRRQLSQAGGSMMGFPQQTDDLGAFRLYALEPGDYYISATPREFNNMPLTGEKQTEGYVQTYFPGTASPQEAKPVGVQAGREIQGVVFSLASSRLARIRGRALMSTGEPFVGAFINVSFRDPGGGMRGTGGGQVRPDGTFEIANVAPGTYMLSVQRNDFGPREPAPDHEIGREVVTINGEDISDVLLVGRRGAIARGRIVTDTGMPLSTPARNFGISTAPADPDQIFSSFRPPGRIADNFTFEITGLFGPTRLQPQIMMMGMPGETPAGRPWTLKAVLLDGHDVTDRGIDFQPGQVVEGIEIVYTQATTNLSGRLLDDRGAATQGTVVVFPSNESLWRPQSRFILISRPTPEGQYRFMNLPPSDDYMIAAVARVEDGQWMDPEFLNTLKDVASRLSLREGETKVQDVKLVKLP